MNRVFDILKKYMIFIAILTGISIVLGMSYSNFIVASENHKVAEMYIGTLKYSMTIDGSTTNTLSVPSGETIVDVTITNENPIDTYYKLIYQNNSNVSIKYYQASELDSSNKISKTYDKSNDKIISNNTNTIKLKITNNSSSSQSINFKIVGGYVTNTLSDVIVPNNYSEIDKIISANTYFCTTTDTLTQGLKYVNGQYTYGYYDDALGWYVKLTDKSSTDTVISRLCTYVNNVPITDMNYMFDSSQASSIDLSSFNTSNVTNMEGMFLSTVVTDLDLSNFDTSKVTTMKAIFESSKLTKLDLSSFNTSNVTNMDEMFFLSELTEINLKSFDTSNVTTMHLMFSNSKIKDIDLSNFDTSNVENMYQMFFRSKTYSIDLSRFDTSKVTNMMSMFQGSSNLKTIYVSNKFKAVSGGLMFASCTSLVGGAGTTFNKSYVDETYAHIDGGTSNPGYFTDIADKPSTFPTDSWDTIVASVKAGNSRGYKVGETKTIDMGTYGTHTLRIANTSTPSECSTSGYSQSACGFVLEFADIITKYNMNTTANSRNGWPASSMYTFVNNDIYNALPAKLKSVIIDTIVVSGHGNYNLSNFTSTDKLYLLSPREVWNYSGTYDAASSSTRQLDYYKEKGVSTSNYSGAIKKNGTSASAWWLRTATSSFNGCYYSVMYTGAPNDNNTAELKSGVSPAFRIG